MGFERLFQHASIYHLGFVLGGMVLAHVLGAPNFSLGLLGGGLLMWVNFAMMGWSISRLLRQSSGRFVYLTIIFLKLFIVFFALGWMISVLQLNVIGVMCGLAALLLGIGLGVLRLKHEMI